MTVGPGGNMANYTFRPSSGVAATEVLAQAGLTLRVPYSN